MGLKPNITGIGNSLPKSLLKEDNRTLRQKNTPKDPRKSGSTYTQGRSVATASGSTPPTKTIHGVSITRLTSVAGLTRRSKPFVFVIVNNISELSQYRNSRVDVVYTTKHMYVNGWGIKGDANTLSIWGMKEGDIGTGAWLTVKNGNLREAFKCSFVDGIPYIPLKGRDIEKLTKIDSEFVLVLGRNINDLKRLNSSHLNHTIIYCDHRMYKKVWNSKDAGEILEIWGMNTNAKPGAWQLSYVNYYTKTAQLLQRFSARVIARPTPPVRPTPRPATPPAPGRAAPPPLAPISTPPSITDLLKNASDTLAFIKVLRDFPGEAVKLHRKNKLRGLFFQSIRKTVTLTGEHLKNNRDGEYQRYLTGLTRAANKRLIRKYGWRNIYRKLIQILRQFPQFSGILKKNILDGVYVAHILAQKNNAARIRVLAQKLRKWVVAQKGAGRSKRDVLLDISPLFLRGRKKRYIKQAGLQIVQELNSIYKTTPVVAPRPATPVVATRPVRPVMPARPEPRKPTERQLAAERKSLRKEIIKAMSQLKKSRNLDALDKSAGKVLSLYDRYKQIGGNGKLSFETIKRAFRVVFDKELRKIKIAARKFRRAQISFEEFNREYEALRSFLSRYSSMVKGDFVRSAKNLDSLISVYLRDTNEISTNVDVIR
ncbi:MAG: hypothetical protein ABIE74_07030, partial [Pseudomonadota bacterium]